ncbi:SAM-dependent methyltransferase [Microbispora cellulosiformans]|uniref:SAM-dependent methyltransferase n=1 Tax=Microbispora cellulosiformans TaxID=2614688 RepID=A0A5J5JYF5_9ACTN|nr:SAM-dependent methyltransferase [Microbispora cellulosiformans]KAA9376858.1 SAM-dependent methyltransferase [Microbispora cellulosiformans]
MDDSRRAPEGVDPTIPNIARMYDYYLGGKDNFAADREAAEKMLAIGRQMGNDGREVARENRGFLRRAVRLLAESGITQFVDIGAGLPTQENVHQVARRHAPGARVVYVDNDPVVLTHARALLADNPETIVVAGDLRDPDAVFDDPGVRAHIDFTRPFAVLLVSVLHFVTDDEDADRITARIRERMVVSGCHLVLSHIRTNDEVAEEAVVESKKVYAATSSGGLVGRPFKRIESFFDGLEILEPGLVPVQAWRPDVPWDVPVDMDRTGIFGAVGRMP